MPNNYKLYCFDMDGVLFSSEGIIGLSYQRAIEKNIDALRARNPQIKEIIVPSTPTIMQEIGKPVPEIFRNLFPQLSESDREFIGNHCLSELVNLIQEKKGLLLEGSYEILRFLHKEQAKVGLASNGRSPYLHAIVDTYDIRKYFTDVYCVDNDFQGKLIATKAGLIGVYMNLYGISPQQTLMIGDRSTDYEAAKIAGCDFAAILSGHGDELNNLPAQFKCYGLPELTQILQNL